MIKNLIMVPYAITFFWAMGYGAFTIFFASMDALNPLTDGSTILTILKYIFFPITMQIGLLYDIFANGSWKILIMGWTYFSFFIVTAPLMDVLGFFDKKGTEKKSIQVNKSTVIPLIVALAGIFFFNKPYDKCMSYYDDWYGESICKVILLTEK